MTEDQGENRMKRCVRALSLLLAFTLMASMCACTAKPSRSGIKHNDAQSKPEKVSGMETEPVPTETDPAQTKPVDTPTPTPADPTPAVNTEPLEMTVSDLMYISELCIGLPPVQATELLTAVLGISIFDAIDGDKGPSGVPLDRFLRNMNRDIVVEGISIKSIGMYTNIYGVVTDINFSARKTALLDSNEAFDSESYFDKLYPVFCDNYGDPDDEYSANWVDFDDSGLYGWDYSDSCWAYVFWGMGCYSVTGNDQFVLGLEHKDPSSVTGSTAAGTVDASFEDVYELMGSVTGLDLAESEIIVETAFGMDLVDPEKTTGSNDVGTVYTYNVDITIEGYSFDQIEFDANAGNIVYHIGFINSRGTGEELHDICIDFRDMASDYLEDDPYLEYPLTDDNEFIEFYDFDLGDGDVLSTGGYYTYSYSSFWFTYEDTSLVF